MTTLIIAAIVCATVITSIVNFAKPAYEPFAGRFATTINIALSFILGIVTAFAAVPLFQLDLSTGAIILVGLALGTGSNIFYDVREIVKGAGDKLRDK